MILRSVLLENYLGWGSLNLDLARPGLTYFCGPNGSGKSSIRDAIRWCLTGKSERAETANGIIRDGGQHGGARVCVALQVGTDRCEIQRARGHRSLGNSISVRWNDDDPIHPRHARASEDLIRQV